MKKVVLYIILSVLIISLAACSSDESNDQITFTAVIEEVHDDTWLVSTSDDVGFDQASVDVSQDLAIAFNPLVGQTVTITVDPEIKESYPVQVTASSVAISDSSDAGPGYQKISSEEAKKIMDSDDAFTLVDVRTQEEYDAGHIEGALLLPLDALETLASEELTDLDQVILLYCRSGNRSGTAARLLLELGYTNVYDFGGIVDWPYDIVKD